MRILVSSNAHWSSTGYGTQTKGLMTALINMGHTVAEHAWYGLQGSLVYMRLAGQTIPVYPRLSHKWGGDTYVAARHFNAQLVISLQDIWVLPNNYAETLPCPWVAWFPIDGSPIPPPVKQMAETAAYPVVYSRFGACEMEQAGLPYDYIPHGIDTQTFRPYDRQEARQQLGIPQDIFFAVMVAANASYPSRKAHVETFSAFKRFHDTHPDSRLYVHTESRATRSTGLNLEEARDMVGLTADNCQFPNIDDYLLGFSNEFMALMYSAANVLLSPSMGEGFGLPIAEAQACGCPVITQDCTSMSELTINGIAIPKGQPFHSPLGNWQYIPNVADITKALEQVYTYRNTKNTRKASQMGIRYFRENYDWSVVAERYWRPFLAKVEEQIAEK